MKITLKNFKCWEHKELTFKDEGIIEIKGSKITILEEKKLVNMLN